MDKCDSNQRCIPYTILISGESEIPSIRLSGKLDIEINGERELLRKIKVYYKDETDEYLLQSDFNGLIGDLNDLLTD